MISPNTTHSSDVFTINVSVIDPECVADLVRLNEGPERDQYASLAFQLGAQVLRQANAVIDHHTIAQEGNRLVGLMGQECKQHFEKTTSEVETLLEKYFDPSDGSLPQRLERLVTNGGELESILRRYVGDSESTLVATLEARLGKDSPLLRQFSTNPDEGVLGAFKGVIRESLSAQNERFKTEFSLDTESSALSRLLKHLTDENGKLRKEFSEDVSTIRNEFSRDNPDGALSRLLSQVGQAHRAIVAEFAPDNEKSVLSRMTQLLESTNKGIQDSLTLDNEDSPLFRLKRELVNVVKDVQDGNKEFQNEVRETLAAIQATRKEAKRSTSHGNTFEDNASDYLRLEAQRLQDGFEATGNSFGAIRKKVGDEVITLGPESAAPGAKIVFECKGNKSYSLKMAMDELEIAKQNREAQCGVFVFKRDSAPDNVEPLIRWGNDVVVIWDDEDPATDIYLKVAYSVARCIAVQKKTEAEGKSGEREAIENAVKAISRKIVVLDSIYNAAKTINDRSADILLSSEKLKKEVNQQIETIEEHIANL